MKSVGPLFAVGLTVLVVALVAVFSFLPGDVSVTRENATTDAGGAELSPINVSQETAFSEREMGYQEPISQLDQWLEEYSLDEAWRMGRMGGRS